MDKKNERSKEVLDMFAWRGNLQVFGRESDC